MGKNNQWLDWLKCNVLEIVILILVLLLLVKVYSAPAVGEVPALTEIAVEKTPELLNVTTPVAQPVNETTTINITNATTPESVSEETPAE